MRIRIFLTTVFILCSLCLFSAHAFADSAAEGGLDLRFGLAADVLRIVPKADASYQGMSYSVTGDTIHFEGLMGQVSIGYRWSMGGIYLTQDLGGVWLHENNEDYKNAPSKGRFLGGTFLVGRFIIPATDSFQIDIGAGVGLMYGHETKRGSDTEYTPSLIYNSDGDPSVAFALKVGISMLYYITPSFGMGVFCDYNYAFKKYDGLEDSIKLKLTNNYHVINPGIQVMMKF